MGPAIIKIYLTHGMKLLVRNEVKELGTNRGYEVKIRILGTDIKCDKLETNVKEALAPLALKQA